MRNIVIFLFVVLLIIVGFAGGIYYKESYREGTLINFVPNGTRRIEVIISTDGYHVVEDGVFEKELVSNIEALVIKRQHFFSNFITEPSNHYDMLFYTYNSNYDVINVSEFCCSDTGDACVYIQNDLGRKIRYDVIGGDLDSLISMICNFCVTTEGLNSVSFQHGITLN